MRQGTKRLISYLLTGMLITINVAPAYAGMVGTDNLLDRASAEINRATVLNALQREEVRMLLVERGITTEQAKTRIDNMTDSEISLLAQRIDELPQGSGAAEVVLVIFLILLITELTGVTDIFPGIDPQR